MNTDTKFSESKPKELPLTFKKDSGETPFKFKQIAKTTKGYIYEVDDEGVIHYEVFERRSGENYNKDGFTVYYPTTRVFGLWAWCCRSLEKAEKRLNDIK